MKLVLQNLTYLDCPVEIREKVTLTAEQRHAISLVEKVLHGPVNFIKNGGGPGDEQLQAIDLINKMFLSQNKGNQ